MLKLDSFKDMVTAHVSKAFESIMTDEIDRIEAQMIERVKKLTEEHKAQARKCANKMALEMLHKMDSGEVSIVFKA